MRPDTLSGWDKFQEGHLNQPAPPYQGITCANAEQLMDAVEALVRRGIGFKANYDGLTINLTGGH